MSLDIPVFVINLERDVERRAAMERALNGRGITAEFVAAVDGKALGEAASDRYDRARCIRIYGVDMLPSEVGCYLSHFSLFERMVADNIPRALILEDDVTFAEDFADVVRGLLAMREVDWRVIRLTTLRPKVEHPVKPKFTGRQLASPLPGYDLYRLKTHVLGAGAYLITLEGARTMIGYGGKFFMPIDHTMDRFWENGIAPLVVRPFPAHQREDIASSIGARDPRRRDAMPLPAQLARRAQRLRDSFAKRLYNLTH